MRKKLLTGILMFFVCISFLSIKTYAADTIDARDPEKASNEWLTNILTFYQYYDYSKNEEMLKSVNAEREKEGLNPVVLDKQLTESAMERVAESSLLFNHDRPIGTDYFTIDSLSKRENQTKYSDVTQAINAYMDSPGHKKNILNQNNKTIGFGFTDEIGNIQIFGEKSHTDTENDAIPDYTGKVWRGYNVFVSNSRYVNGLRVDMAGDNDHFSKMKLSQNTLLKRNGSIRLIPRLMMDTEDHIDSPGSLGAPPFAAAGGVWHSSDESVATVELSTDKNVCIVRATGNPGDECDITFTVNEAIDLAVTYHFTIANISIDDITLDLADLKYDTTASGNVYYFGGSSNIKPHINITPTVQNPSVVWSEQNRNDTAEIIIEDDGTITWTRNGVGVGDVTYSAYVNNSYVEGIVHVINSATSMKITPASYQIDTGKTTTINITSTNGNPKIVGTETVTNNKITWISSNENVATVDKDGVVTGKSQGSATITAKWNGNKELEDSITVTVKPLKDSLKASYAYPMYVDFFAKLNLNYSGNNTLTYTSSKPAVLSIDEDGTMHGLAVGVNVKITVSAPNADPSYFYVSVKDRPTLGGSRGSVSSGGYTYETMSFSATSGGTDTIKSYLIQKLENGSYKEYSNNNQSEFKPNVNSYTSFRAKAIYASGIETSWYNFGLSRSGSVIVVKPDPTPTAPPAPTPTPTVKAPGKPKISSISTAKKKLTVKWKKVSGASGYVIYRSTKKGSGYKKVKTITKGSTVKWVNTKLKAKKTYYYKIKSYKKAYGQTKYSGYSSVKSKKTK